MRGAWVPTDDEKLLELVHYYGAKRWSLIAGHIQGRTGKQCRERWHNHLRGGISKREWTDLEHQILMEAQARLGNKWSAISKLLPNRTDNQCKNRWNCIMGRRRTKLSTVGVSSTVGIRCPAAAFDALHTIPGSSLSSASGPGMLANRLLEHDQSSGKSSSCCNPILGAARDLTATLDAEISEAAVLAKIPPSKLGFEPVTLTVVDDKRSEPSPPASVKSGDSALMTFPMARQIVRELRLTSLEAWEAWSQSCRPPRIPAQPDVTYEGRGWISWQDWIGSSAIVANSPSVPVSVDIAHMEPELPSSGSPHKKRRSVKRKQRPDSECQGSPRMPAVRSNGIESLVAKAVADGHISGYLVRWRGCLPELDTFETKSWLANELTPKVLRRLETDFIERESGAQVLGVRGSTNILHPNGCTYPLCFGLVWLSFITCCAMRE